MDILFVHQNFPAQFQSLAPELARLGHKVCALTMLGQRRWVWRGVTVIPYSPQRSSAPQLHPWVSDLETKVIRGEACLRASQELKNNGFNPDVIISHPGWGESLFLKELWPAARLGIYCEFFYLAHGADTGFDPEFPQNATENACRLKLKNVNALLHMEQASAGISPTSWQASTFPQPFRNRITVAHDGIDTQHLAPREDASLVIKTRSGQNVSISKSQEVVTFVNRNLEPYRGFHIFMRALPTLLKRRRNARVVIVGGDGVSYGAAPPKKELGPHADPSIPVSWRQVFQDEIRDQISPEDWDRVHFVGNIGYREFVSLLQISTAHVYLTYPFVLSWSLLEAMSLGCAIVASKTPPVVEVIDDRQSGILVDFFDKADLVEQVCELLDDPTLRHRLGVVARQLVVSKYDLKTQCLPKQISWVNRLHKDEK